MSTCVIELNDAGVRVSNRDGELLLSPGYALAQDDGVVVGEAAASRARLEPRRVYTRFWDALSLEPLAGAPNGIRSQADLAHAHLGSVWEAGRLHADRAILAVPGSFGRDRLALILGLAHDCGIEVAGMVDAAVAAVDEAPPARRIVHLDAQLHRVVATRLEQGTRLRRVEVTQLADAGLAELRDVWANAIGDAFVRFTRFDPMTTAAGEQQLYAKLDAWLDALRDEESATLELDAGMGSVHSVTVKAERIEQAALGIYDRILQLVNTALSGGDATGLVLSHRIAALPGLKKRLESLARAGLVELSPDSLTREVFAHEPEIVAGGDNTTFVTSKSWRAPAVSVQAPESAPSQGAPTHLLYQSRAYPLGAEPLVVGAQAGGGNRIGIVGALQGVSRRHCTVSANGNGVRLEDHSTYGTWLNGDRVHGSAELHVGDRVRVGSPGHELQLIRVVAT